MNENWPDSFYHNLIMCPRALKGADEHPMVRNQPWDDLTDPLEN